MTFAKILTLAALLLGMLAAGIPTISATEQLDILVTESETARRYSDSHAEGLPAKQLVSMSGHGNVVSFTYTGKLYANGGWSHANGTGIRPTNGVKISYRSLTPFDISDMEYFVFDLYVSDPELIKDMKFHFELTSSSVSDKQELSWNNKTLAELKGSPLEKGWNAINIKLDSNNSQNANGGAFDPTNWNFFRIYNADATDLGEAELTLAFDKVGFAKQVYEPDYYVETTIAISDCDTADGWMMSTTDWWPDASPTTMATAVIDTNNSTEGTGSLSYTLTGGTYGSGLVKFQYNVPNDPKDITGMERLCFDLYLSDAASLGNVRFELELRGKNGNDNNELRINNTTLSALLGGTLRNGWNHFEIPISRFAKAGTVDLTTWHYMRLFLPQATGQLIGKAGEAFTVKMDNVYFTSRDFDLPQKQDLVYALNADGVSYRVVGYEGVVSEIVIPDTYQGLPVTAIGDGAFFGRRDVERVSIPDSVRDIGDQAFYGCRALTNIAFGANSQLTHVGDAAFALCQGLTSVTLPSRVTSIGRDAFYSCAYLRDLYLPASVQRIGRDAFSFCSRLNAVYITDIAAWCAIDFENNGSSPLVHAGNLFVGGTLLTELTVPDGVTAIGARAFRGYSKLTRVTLPASVRSIGDGAFADCANLTGVGFTGNVTSIGNYAFADCTALPGITIPDGVRDIGHYAFYQNIALTNVTLPRSTATLGARALLGCSNLTSITLQSPTMGIYNEPYTLPETAVIKGMCTSTAQDYAAEYQRTFLMVSHTWNQGVVTTAPTHLTEGVKTFTCVCGVSYTASVDKLPEHTWDGGVVTTAPTHLTEGVKTFTCACKATKTEPVDKLAAHQFGDWHPYNSLQHVHSCPCGEVEYADHAWNGAVTLEPTYTKPGIRTYTCLECGESYTESIPVLPVPEGATHVAPVSKYAAAGQRVTVDIVLSNNPGIGFLSLKVFYDTNALTLVGAVNGGVFSDFTPGTNLTWDSHVDNTKNGVLGTLIFEVNENTDLGVYGIELRCNEVYNLNEEQVALIAVCGTVTVVDAIYGDANADGTVNGQDLLLLRKYLANFDYETGTSTIVVETGADANGDGAINGQDLLLLRKYLANYDYETGTSTIVLGPAA